MGSTTVLVPPDTAAFVSLAEFKAEVGTSVSDAVVQILLDQAERFVKDRIGWPLSRARYVQTHPGNDRTTLRLQARPIASIDAVSRLGVTIAAGEVSIGDRKRGDLYYPSRFSRSPVSQVYAPGSSLYDVDPNAWSFTTTAGYFANGDVTTQSLTAMASDSSYNGVGFPTHLRPMDEIEASGFPDPINNGIKIVESATATKIIITGALVDEGPVSATLSPRPMVPGQIPMAIKMLANSALASRTRDPALVEEAIDGATRLRWSDRAIESTEKSVLDLIAPFMDPRPIPGELVRA